jgi:3-deoxy-D-manno-octulosonate 8-phosphate phosphatase (KDO 8-P phosphatase)
LAVRPVVGLLIAPADACATVRQGAHAVLRNKGGHGAIRELAERILQTRGRWQKLKRDGWRDRND